MRTTGIILFLGIFVACAKASTDDTEGFVDSGNPNNGKDGGLALDSGNNNGSDGSMQQNDSSMGVDSGSNCKTVPPNNLCGLDPQCGCGANGTCDVDLQLLNGTTKCVQSTGNGQIKSACKTTADCAAGLGCLFGACRPYCSTNGTKCQQPNTTNCLQLVDNNMAPIQNLLVCELDCQLDNANDCGGPNEACVYFGNSDVDCRDATGANSTTCSQQKPVCSPGYVCLSNYTCAKWCKVGQNSCPNNKTCVSFSTKVIIKNVEYGACQ